MKQKIVLAGTITWRQRDDRVEYLLVKQTNHSDWGFPKGKQEEFETTEMCAERETFEETSLAVRVQEYVVNIEKLSASGKHSTLILYTAVLEDDTTVINKSKLLNSSEIVDVQWFNSCDIESGVVPLRDYQNVALMYAKNRIENFKLRERCSNKVGESEQQLIQDVYTAVDTLAGYAPQLDSWKRVKKELLKITLGRARKLFSTNKYTTDVLVTKFEELVISRWNTKTGNNIPLSNGSQPTREIALQDNSKFSKNKRRV
jgi:8-oxo-dGTP pyrophosphatase MutT (NUDIX family)